MFTKLASKILAGLEYFLGSSTPAGSQMPLAMAATKASQYLQPSDTTSSPLSNALDGAFFCMQFLMVVTIALFASSMGSAIQASVIQYRLQRDSLVRALASEVDDKGQLIATNAATIDDLNGQLGGIDAKHQREMDKANQQRATELDHARSLLVKQIERLELLRVKETERLESHCAREKSTLQKQINDARQNSKVDQANIKYLERQLEKTKVATALGQDDERKGPRKSVTMLVAVATKEKVDRLKEQHAAEMVQMATDHAAALSEREAELGVTHQAQLKAAVAEVEKRVRREARAAELEDRPRWAKKLESERDAGNQRIVDLEGQLDRKAAEMTDLEERAARRHREVEAKVGKLEDLLYEANRKCSAANERETKLSSDLKSNLDICRHEINLREAKIEENNAAYIREIEDRNEKIKQNVAIYEKELAKRDEQKKAACAKELAARDKKIKKQKQANKRLRTQILELQANGPSPASLPPPVSSPSNILSPPLASSPPVLRPRPRVLLPPPVSSLPPASSPPPVSSPPASPVPASIPLPASPQPRPSESVSPTSSTPGTGSSRDLPEAQQAPPVSSAHPSPVPGSLPLPASPRSTASESAAPAADPSPPSIPLPASPILNAAPGLVAPGRVAGCDLPSTAAANPTAEATEKPTEKEKNAEVMETSDQISAASVEKEPTQELAEGGEPDPAAAGASSVAQEAAIDQDITPPPPMGQTNEPLETTVEDLSALFEDTQVEEITEDSTDRVETTAEDQKMGDTAVDAPTDRMHTPAGPFVETEQPGDTDMDKDDAPVPAAPTDSEMTEGDGNHSSRQDGRVDDNMVDFTATDPVAYSQPHQDLQSFLASEPIHFDEQLDQMPLDGFDSIAAGAFDQFMPTGGDFDSASIGEQAAIDDPTFDYSIADFNVPVPMNDFDDWLAPTQGPGTAIDQATQHDLDALLFGEQPVRNQQPTAESAGASIHPRENTYAGWNPGQGYHVIEQTARGENGFQPVLSAEEQASLDQQLSWANLASAVSQRPTPPKRSCQGQEPSSVAPGSVEAVPPESSSNPAPVAIPQERVTFDPNIDPAIFNAAVQVFDTRSDEELSRLPGGVIDQPPPPVTPRRIAHPSPRRRPAPQQQRATVDWNIDPALLNASPLPISLDFGASEKVFRAPTGVAVDQQPAAAATPRRIVNPSPRRRPAGYAPFQVNDRPATPGPSAPRRPPPLIVTITDDSSAAPPQSSYPSPPSTSVPPVVESPYFSPPSSSSAPLPGLGNLRPRPEDGPAFLDSNLFAPQPTKPNFWQEKEQAERALQGGGDSDDDDAEWEDASGFNPASLTNPSAGYVASAMPWMLEGGGAAAAGPSSGVGSAAAATTSTSNTGASGGGRKRGADTQGGFDVAQAAADDTDTQGGAQVADEDDGMVSLQDLCDEFDKQQRAGAFDTDGGAGENNGAGENEGAGGAAQADEDEDYMGFGMTQEEFLRYAAEARAANAGELGGEEDAEGVTDDGEDLYGPG
ncbi:MAG: hypothetical protein Q9185_006173 [Variospora sp. 1 TL-2023]